MNDLRKHLTVILLDSSRVTSEPIGKFKKNNNNNNNNNKKGFGFPYPNEKESEEKRRLQKESKEHEMALESGLGSFVVVCTLRL